MVLKNLLHWFLLTTGMALPAMVMFYHAFMHCTKDIWCLYTFTYRRYLTFVVCLIGCATCLKMHTLLQYLMLVFVAMFSEQSRWHLFVVMQLLHWFTRNSQIQAVQRFHNGMFLRSVHQLCSAKLRCFMLAPLVDNPSSIFLYWYVLHWCTFHSESFLFAIFTFLKSLVIFIFVSHWSISYFELRRKT